MIESIDDLIVFLKHFHRNLLADPSLPPEQIPTDLPQGLAKIYRELGRLVNIEPPGPFSTQDMLVPVMQLDRVDRMIGFCYENQAIWSAPCPFNQHDAPL